MSYSLLAKHTACVLLYVPYYDHVDHPDGVLVTVITCYVP